MAREELSLGSLSGRWEPWEHKALSSVMGSRQAPDESGLKMEVRGGHWHNGGAETQPAWPGWEVKDIVTAREYKGSRMRTSGSPNL